MILVIVVKYKYSQQGNILTNRKHGCIPKSLISKTLKAHDIISWAPTIPKTLISGAHGMASCAPLFRVFEPI